MRHMPMGGHRGSHINIIMTMNGINMCSVTEGACLERSKSISVGTRNGLVYRDCIVGMSETDLCLSRKLSNYL